MTRSNQRQIPLSAETKPPAGSPRGGATYVSKLRAVDRLSGDILSKVETSLRENPAGVLNASCLPREVEDRQAYFFEKISHARGILGDLAELLKLGSAASDDRELLKAELAMLFALVQSYQPEHIQESGWNPSEDIRAAVHEKLESLTLDIINLRERLK